MTKIEKFFTEAREIELQAMIYSNMHESDDLWFLRMEATYDMLISVADNLRWAGNYCGLTESHSA